MKCTKCGASNDDQSKFCIQCGSNLIPQNNSINNYYTELDAKDKLCNKLKYWQYFWIPGVIIIYIVFIGIYSNFADKITAQDSGLYLCAAIGIAIFGYLLVAKIFQSLYKKFEVCALKYAGQSDWKFTNTCDYSFSVKSKRAIDIDQLKFFKEDRDRVNHAINVMRKKSEYKSALLMLLNAEEIKKLSMYKRLATKIKTSLQNLDNYYILASYSSPTGKSQAAKTTPVHISFINKLESDPSLYMSKSEFNRFLKENAKNMLADKKHSFYNRINSIIDIANNSKEYLINKNDSDKLDELISNDLLSKTISTIDKIKDINSEEWDLLSRIINNVSEEANKLIAKNKQISEYYKSEEFLKIKSSCDTLMSSQREFNEYITQKIKSISELFGKSVSRNETEIEDEYNYIRPYKKRITPFTAEVSDAIFDSAENYPLDYVVKQFYPNKAAYPEQIQKLQLLIEELETLKDAKRIIETHKQEVQQYLSNVPLFIMENDKEGFYSKLGFASINESTLTIEYEFANTSRGGKTRRHFSVPMNEENIIKLIETLESKLTMAAFTKEQRSLMTTKLRQHIKERDNFTCKLCGNSTHKEPNLLLEIDHIIPVAKGGLTEESNLQTLCWKCNRKKSDKL